MAKMATRKTEENLSEIYAKTDKEIKRTLTPEIIAKYIPKKKEAV